MEWILQYPLILQWAIMLIAGIVYGGLIGLIPSAGPGKAIIMLFVIVQQFDFVGGNYLFVLFSVTTMVACTIGDSFASVLLGIPGASGAAATMVDGFPLAKKGKASYALSSAITVSTLNGLLYGALGMAIIPFYGEITKHVGIPEIFGLILIAFALISVVTTKNTLRSLIAIGIGLFMGSIGYGMMGETRHTFGWEYLEDGVPVVIVAAGLFAIPEMWEAYVTKYEVARISRKEHNKQTWDGILAVWKHKWLALMGGAIGFVVGILPGTGGGIGDWSSYSATVALNSKEKVKFGTGNIKGVIGPEGANNAGKMGGLLPTIMFGIPGGKVFALLMALWLYVGFEVGNSAIMADTQFMGHLLWGYMAGTLFAGIGMLAFARQCSKIVYINPLYWIPPMLGLTIWAVLASRYYNTVWEDLTILVLIGILGCICKNWRFSRPALLMSYILFPRIEESWLQLTGVFFWDDFEAIGEYFSTGDTTNLADHYILNNPLWYQHPTLAICIVIAILLICY
jgi:TctA family transporter